jgi:DNA-binding MurR/RpiR family transcriptional regulator
MRNNDTSNDATTAKRVMMEEAKSIISSAEKLDDSDIEQAIEILFKTSGKIIITGIGKSGHVGKKWPRHYPAPDRLLIFYTHPKRCMEI